MRFTPGQTVLRRYFVGDRLTFINVVRVIADDERGLRLWWPAGASYWRMIDVRGRTHHDVALHDMDSPRLTELTWEGADVLVFVPPRAAFSVWWFFDPETKIFKNWYGNLEVPYVRWDGGVDSSDQALDVLVAADGRWRLKDVDEFEARIGQPGYWTASAAAEVRAEAERLGKIADAREFPFDGTWCDFRPDPDWSVPVRPDGWDAPRAY